MADYNSIQRRRNLLVGGFVLVAFCGFVWMLGVFGELPGLVSSLNSYEILVDFPSAPGIMENTRVNYCGYQVGRVMDVLPPQRVEDRDTGESLHRVRVVIAIDNKFNNIPRNIEVQLMKRGLGSSYIELVFDPKKKVEGLLQSGEVLAGIEGTSTEFIPKAVQDKLEKLVDGVSELTAHANEIIGDDENKQNVKRTLNNVALASQQAQLTLLSVQNFADKGIEDLDSVTRNMNDALAELHGVLLKVNEGEGTAGRIVNDGRLYENLLDSTLELQLALEQFKMFAAESREKGLKIKW